MKDKEIPEEMRINRGEETFYINLGKNIRKVRNKLGLSIEDVAKKIGVSAIQLEKYENGVLAIPIYHFMPLLQYMGFPKELESAK